MSNPTTQYTVGGLDLSAIFQPLSQGSAIGYDTNYAVSGYGGDGTCNMTPGCGEDAVSGFSQLYGNYFYGSGGGVGVGGYISVPISNYGGNGSNGVVMLWWLD